jgi:hypothetical protein
LEIGIDIGLGVGAGVLATSSIWYKYLGKIIIYKINLNNA